jgi:hypothetical protein
MEDDGVTAQLDDTEGEVRLPAYCKHPDLGFRMVAFCKLLVVWNVWRQNPQIDDLVVIGEAADSITLLSCLADPTPSTRLGRRLQIPEKSYPVSSRLPLTTSSGRLPQGSSL